ncbi:hypothetical protein MNB_SV-13-945 [hydrothermal vent metagenome]|uniref:DUF3782 domain-containing protein n=1 Tax=hydrothermal vent metagenome TaxID=652676 RepID=A0A1W1D0N4_9ZZZZ
MITYQELMESIAELQKSQEKTEKYIQETSEQMRQTDEQMKKTDEQMKQTDMQMKKTDKQIKALSRNIDGVNKSIGLEVEDFFYSSLKENPILGNTKFDYVYQNSKRDFKGESQEIDILLENGSTVGVVEVKNKVSQKSIDQLDTIMERFDYFHPIYKDYKVIGAIAGKIFPKHLQTQALNKGYSVLMQQGKHREQIDPK